MTWNHRIMAAPDGDGYEYGLYEVYYNEKGEPTGYTSDAIPIVGESIKEIRWILDKVEEALMKPVLSYEDFPKVKEPPELDTGLLSRLIKNSPIESRIRVAIQTHFIDDSGLYHGEQATPILQKVHHAIKKWRAEGCPLKETKKPTNMTTEQKVQEWFEQKGLNKKENRYKQLAKATEELGELAGAIAKDKDKELKLELGDVAVTLIGLAGQHDTTLEECLSLAYDKISKRKGETRDGVFVKEGD